MRSFRKRKVNNGSIRTFAHRNLNEVSPCSLGSSNAGMRIGAAGPSKRFSGTEVDSVPITPIAFGVAATVIAFAPAALTTDPVEAATAASRADVEACVRRPGSQPRGRAWSWAVLAMGTRKIVVRSAKGMSLADGNA